MNIRLHPAEQFLNYFPRHTQLYVRGERGKSAAETDAIYRKLFHDLVPFFDRLLADYGIEWTPAPPSTATPGGNDA